jgi:putative endonuclease
LSEERLIGVYMMADKPRGTIYIGFSGYLARRIYEHREGALPGFTRRYGLKRLVWYEIHDDITVAYQRERSLKRYLRQWKINLIEQDNPHWHDRYAELI